MAKATLDTQAEAALPKSETTMTIMGRSIRQNDKGLICLMGQWKAAGAKPEDRPASGYSLAM